MELKFKEVDDRYETLVFSDDKDTEFKVKQYLTIEEINDIVNQMLETENQVERYMIKICKVTEYCTNIDLDEFTDEYGAIKGEDVYNLVAEIGLIDQFDEIIDNYYMIDRLVKDSESTYNLVKSITEDLTQSIKGFDITKLQSGLGEIAKQVGGMGGNK